MSLTEYYGNHPALTLVTLITLAVCLAAGVAALILRKAIVKRRDGSNTDCADCTDMPNGACVENYGALSDTVSQSNSEREALPADVSSANDNADENSEKNCAEDNSAKDGAIDKEIY